MLFNFNFNFDAYLQQREKRERHGPQALGADAVLVTLTLAIKSNRGG
jgi:hypothetical protein